MHHEIYKITGNHNSKFLHYELGKYCLQWNVFYEFHHQSSCMTHHSLFIFAVDSEIFMSFIYLNPRISYIEFIYLVIFCLLDQTTKYEILIETPILIEPVATIYITCGNGLDFKFTRVQEFGAQYSRTIIAKPSKIHKPIHTVCLNTSEMETNGSIIYSIQIFLFILKFQKIIFT